MLATDPYDLIVIGGGHAGAEAVWAAANLGARCALVTMDPLKIGAMSCNPAIGGLAKGQIVREIDALGGLMALATDATGIQFRILNASKGPAVQGPRAQCDKYQYARQVRLLLSTRPQITILAGTVDDILVSRHRVTGVLVSNAQPWQWSHDMNDLTPCDHSAYITSRPDTCRDKEAVCHNPSYPLIAPPPSDQTPDPGPSSLAANAVVLTTGTFMRGLMHTGPRQTPGGRVNESAAVPISAALRNLGFDLGRLKTGTPPRLAAESIDFASLPLQPGDDTPTPFSDLSPAAMPGRRFPVLEQKPCHLTHTNHHIHQIIRDNIHLAPMYNGQIQTTGPRYCPSIEDKVVRFADRTSHHVYLEPESLHTNEIYCNGISTSLPADVQEQIVRLLPGCEHAQILRHGYAVEYDMVWPHQIDATGMTKLVPGLFLAGQINGTSGYEEAAGQGLIAGLNAVRFIRNQSPVRLRRDQAYIGVMIDDLVTKTPREPYRMFTSRAEYRLLLRGDNADHRLTPLGCELGLVDDLRWQNFQLRSAALTALRDHLTSRTHDGQKLIDLARRPEIDEHFILDLLNTDPATDLPPLAHDRRLVQRLLADVKYAGYVDRQDREVRKLSEMETRPLPLDCDYTLITGLRTEARAALAKFRPATVGQASRLAGITPADLMVVTVSLGK